jgi:hypothetical protein
MPPAIVVATTQATAIAGVSNILAQILDHWQKAVRHARVHHGSCRSSDNEQEPFAFSWSDFIRFLVLNIIVAPPNFHWQAWLEKTFPARKSAERYEISPESMELGESRQFLDKDDDRGKVIITETGREKNFNWVNTFKKWFLDCIFVGAIMNTLAFLIIMGMMKGKNLAELQTAVQKVSRLGPSRVCQHSSDYVKGNHTHYHCRIQDVAHSFHR